MSGKDAGAKLLSRDDLLRKQKLEIVRVDLGDNEYVYVRQMTGRERDRFEQSLLKEVVGRDGSISYDRSLEDFRAKLAVNTICDEQGNNLLQPNDYALLSQNMSAARLERIVNAAQKLNSISEEDREALVKNSESAQKDASTSG